MILESYAFRESSDQQSYTMGFTNGICSYRGEPLAGYETTWFGWGSGNYSRIRRWPGDNPLDTDIASSTQNQYYNFKFVWNDEGSLNLKSYRDGSLRLEATDATYSTRDSWVFG